VRHLDLFSGIGGFALAAEAVGWETIAFAEVDEYASSVLRTHWPGIDNVGDVTKLCRRVYDCEYDEESGEAWCPRCDDDFGECACVGTDQFTDTYGFPDVVTAGVPCQPTSQIGKRGGVGDGRWLWPDTIRVVSELRPRFVIAENPAAILTLEHGRAFNGIASGLVEIGYDMWWDVLPAYAVGAGHRRERCIIVATDSDCAGLERYAGYGEESGEQKQNRPTTAPDLRTRRFDERRWYSQSGIEPVVNGIPGKVARQQMTAIGNAIVPQVAQMIMEAIKAVELAS